MQKFRQLIAVYILASGRNLIEFEIPEWIDLYDDVVRLIETSPEGIDLENFRDWRRRS
jgi:hypothetical protein